jgi:4-hydroxy-tetrahydrodipicolinate synthase
MLDVFEAGDVRQAREIHDALMPVFTGIFRTQGVMTVKAALTQRGIVGGAVRPPLVDLTQEQFTRLTLDLAEGGVEGFSA